MGNNDIASVVTELKVVFKEHFGKDTLTYYDSNGPLSNVLSGKVDYNIYKLRNLVPYFRPRRISSRIRGRWESYLDKYFFEKAVKECDIFIFFWNTFKKDYSDLEILKKLGKKVFVCFVGDDVRWYFGQKQEFNGYGMRHIEYSNYDYSVKGLESKLSYLRMAEKHADAIFSRLDQHQLGLRPYYRWHMMIDSTKYTEHNIQRKENPIVVHAPTNRLVKGTDFVLDAFQRLENEGIKFRKILVENMAHADALKTYESADIVIDQLICPGSGKLASESLAYGKVVLGHMAYGIYPQNTNALDYPIVDVNPETLYVKLKELILDHEQRQKIANASRKFAENTLDFRHFCDKILKLANGEIVPYDYTPFFFREKFVPESTESVQTYNSWTDLEKKEKWYHDFVKPGNREGLIF